MTELRGVALAIFGVTDATAVSGWVDRHVRDRLGAGVGEELFAAGDIGAVFGVRLDDGREVVVKALRAGWDLRRLRAVARLQNRLAEQGFGCAKVLDGPAVTDGVVAIVEELLTCESSGDPHDPADRAAMAAGLAAQIDVLRGVDGTDLVAGRPAWTQWDNGPWPEPHDPIFDFTAPVPGYEWLDRLAAEASVVLRAADDRARYGGGRVVGHSDWVWQNVRVRDGVLVAGYDWDSLVYAPEPAVVGVSAGAFTQGSPSAPDAPTAAEVQAFLEDYQAARGRDLDQDERRVFEAAATWIRCYNARCQLDNLVRRGMPPPQGPFVDQLSAEFGRG